MRSLRPTPGPRSKGEGPRRRRGEEIDGLTKETIRRDAEDASPLGWLSERMKENSSSSPLVHYSYAAEKDFFICRPHVKSLTNILGEENVQVLEIPVLGHFESHFSLADPTCEWHDAFRKTVSSL